MFADRSRLQFHFYFQVLTVLLLKYHCIFRFPICPKAAQTAKDPVERAETGRDPTPQTPPQPPQRPAQPAPRPLPRLSPGFTRLSPGFTRLSPGLTRIIPGLSPGLNRCLPSAGASAVTSTQTPPQPAPSAPPPAYQRRLLPSPVRPTPHRESTHQKAKVRIHPPDLIHPTKESTGISGIQSIH